MAAPGALEPREWSQRVRSVGRWQRHKRRRRAYLRLLKYTGETCLVPCAENQISCAQDPFGVVASVGPGGNERCSNLFERNLVDTIVNV